MPNDLDIEGRCMHADEFIQRVGQYQLMEASDGSGKNDFIFRNSGEPDFDRIFSEIKVIYRANPEHKALLVSGI
jgi:hypothetical protein